LILKTDARALVPRPETEIVVERALAAIEGLDAPRVIDVGTGSGAIALALKHERPDARVTATDISAAALSLAGENAERNGLDVELVETDLLAGVAGPFELVVSNPPYVLADELPGLEPEVRDWEPELALVDAGQTTMLAASACDLLDGWLVLEVHERLAERTRAHLSGLGYAAATISLDLGGRERIVEARWEPTATSRGL
jgi:release factor glutamine methyltransferase